MHGVQLSVASSKMKQLLWKLPLILSLGFAITSCSTTGHMQNMPVAAKNTVVQQQAIISKHATIIHKKHRPVQAHTHKTTTKKTISNTVHPSKHVVKHQAARVIQENPAPIKKKPAPVKPVQTTPVAMPVSKTKPVINTTPMTAATQDWVLNEQSINMEPRIYRNMQRQHEVIGNLHQLDVMRGNYHYVQIVRWDGANINQSIINARTAILDAIIGLSFLNNSYIETNLGVVIMVLGGNAYIFELPGHHIDMLLIPAKAGSRSPLEKSLLPRTKLKHEPMAKYTEMLDGSRQGICAYFRVNHTANLAIYQLPANISS